MIALSRGVRSILVIVASFDLFIFSQHGILVVLCQAMGATLILLGLQSSYRPASLVGLLLIATASASAIALPSLLEVGQIITAIASLAIPVFMLTWLALSAEEGESRDVLLLKRPAMVAVMFAVICLFSAPVTLLIVSLFAPTTSIRITPTTEMAITLTVTVAGAVLLTRKMPQMAKPAKSLEQAKE